jgi:hypothetical protein
LQIEALDGQAILLSEVDSVDNMVASLSLSLIVKLKKKNKDF